MKHALLFAGSADDWPDGLGDEDCILYLESLMGEFALAMYEADKEYDVRSRQHIVLLRNVSASFHAEVGLHLDKLTFDGIYIKVPKGPFAPKSVKL